MVGQLPEGSEGALGGSLFLAALSLIGSSLLIWLTWCHNERLSYVALLAYFAFLSTICSLIQQGHTVARYRDIQVEEYEHRLQNPHSPESRIANGSVGMDLVLYYIQFYCYQVMALLVLWWASELAQSVYGLTHKKSTRRILRKINACGKVFGMVLPLVTILILQAPPVRNNQLAFTVITDVPVAMAMGLGSLLMLAIIGRYIHSRRKLLKFDPAQGASSTDPESQVNSKASSRISKISRGRKRAIYDRWLMARFSVAFLFLALFQGTATLFQQLSIRTFNAAAGVPGPRYDADFANQLFYLFIPGNVPGIALFLVFGTTTAFRQYMYKKYQAFAAVVSKPFKRNGGRSYDDLPSPRVSNVFRLQAMQPDLMKSLPHPPNSQHNGTSVECFGSNQTARLKPHDPRSIHVMRTLSVETTMASGKAADDGNITDSSQDSSPSLIIMTPTMERKLTSG